MKKICLLTVLLLSAAMCFAQDYDSDDFDQNKSKLNGLFVDFGGSYLKNYHFDVLPGVNYVQDSSANDFTFDIGKFKSPENGLFDFVSFDLAGFNFGTINTSNNLNYTYDDVLWNIEDKGKYIKVYSKESWGPQVNFFCFSWAWLFGFQSGYQFTQLEAYNNASRNSILYEHKFFVDFSTATYFSFKIHEFMKFFIITETDIPIVNYRFAYTDSIEKEFTTKGFYWFDKDRPVSITLGTSILF